MSHLPTSQTFTAEMLLRIASVQQELSEGSLQVQALMDLAVDRARELAHAHSSYIDLVDGASMICGAASDANKGHVGVRFQIETSLSGRCVRTGQVMVCHDTETDPRVDRELCRIANARSMVLVPLRTHNTTLGALKVCSAEPAAFTPATVAILSFLSQLLAAAMRQTKAFADKEDALHVLRAREREIAQLNQDLEERINARTAEMVRDQDRFQFALEAARLVAWDWDLTTSIINRFGFLGDLGTRFPLREKMTLETMLGRISNDQRPAVEYALRRALAGDGIYFIEYSVTLGDHTRWLRHSGRCDFDATHKPLRIRGVTADITAQREADAENERVRALAAGALAREQAALHASEMKSTFLANMSHEIRTPINGVMGLASLLEESPLSNEQRSYARSIHSCANNLLAIINDILDLSKAESGKMTLDLAVFDLPQLVEDVMRVLRIAAQEKGLQFMANIAPNVPDTLLGDATRLRQILLNLLGNAVKFTAAGKVNLNIEMLSCQAGAAQLQFAIHDQGIGVAPNVLPTLFTPFTQADASTTRRFGGTGLGLTICKRLVELMGGDIAARSDEGRGSVFHFRVCLPIRQQCESTVPAPHVPTFVGEPLRVLVAEDNAINQLIVRKLLEKEGCIVTVVDNGLAAVRVLHQQHFGIVFMDCQMPEMDGFEATQLIRKSPDPRVALTPIIALTANAMSGDRERCLDAGMNGYLSKPINPAKLAAELGAHARRP